MATILVLEDDQQLQQAYKDIFSQAGHTVSLCSTVQDSIEYMNHNQPPHLIIVDLMLPGGKNGFDFIEQVKSDPVWQSIPIFLMTNLPGMDTSAQSLHVNEYFEKVNVSLESVLQKAEQYLNK